MPQVTKTPQVILEEGYYLLQLVNVAEVTTQFGPNYNWHFVVAEEDPAIAGVAISGFTPTACPEGGKLDTWLTAVNGGQPLPVAQTVAFEDFYGAYTYGYVKPKPSKKQAGKFMNTLDNIRHELPRGMGATPPVQQQPAPAAPPPRPRSAVAGHQQVPQQARPAHAPAPAMAPPPPQRARQTPPPGAAALAPRPAPAPAPRVAQQPPQAEVVDETGVEDAYDFPTDMETDQDGLQ